MFGFQGGESAEIVAREGGDIKDAQHRSPFLINDDLSTIKIAGQLCSMVKMRHSISMKRAMADVAAWMQSK